MNVSLLLVIAALSWVGDAEVPRCEDDRVQVRLFCEHPQLVTPTGLAVDARGRVFVAESHTHFRPDDYVGPESDRILVFVDRDQDGQPDARHVFHEGFTHVMDMAFHPEGALYVATRKDIHRMVDRDGDLRADSVEPIVQLATTGTYPHNGISGLCFNADGSLNFGLGENLGHAYTLSAQDGSSFSGGGEGGSTYRVAADGSRLARITTGWWNPFGMCVDPQGRIFGTDNDPGASPPCRLLQIHPGADYGYEYRYGRTGLHPLITWTGELPGTLPMVGGTGEAPCGIISTATTGLPKKYRGDLLVACWADHRVERFELIESADRGQVRARRHDFLTGPNEFRPVDLGIAPDGSIYLSDWVSASYQLHGQGRIWKITTTDGPTPGGPFESTPDSLAGLRRMANSNASLGARARAVRQLLRAHEEDPAPYLAPHQPLAVQAEALAHADVAAHGPQLDSALASRDPLVRHAALDALAAQVDRAEFKERYLADNVVAATTLLALKRSARRASIPETDLLTRALAGPDPEAWQVAVKWIADDGLAAYDEALTKALDSPRLTVQQYLMLEAARSQLAGKKPTDVPSSEQLVAAAMDPVRPNAVRAAAMRLLGPENGDLATGELLVLAREESPLQVEAVRLLAGRAAEETESLLSSLATDTNQPRAVRLEALAALPIERAAVRSVVFAHLPSASAAWVEAALQALTGTPLTGAEREGLTHFVSAKPQWSQAVRRVLGPEATPQAQPLAAWLRRLKGPGDPVAGERIFFHTRVGTCGRCHRHGGRGRAVGPSLSLIARSLPQDRQRATRQLLETILDPSQDMAPQYTPWTIVTRDGRQLTGLPRRKGGGSEAYLGIDGKEFSVRKDDIESHGESRTSLMPEGLLDALTDKELRDLFAFLLGN